MFESRDTSDSAEEREKDTLSEELDFALTIGQRCTIGMLEKANISRVVTNDGWEFQIKLENRRLYRLILEPPPESWDYQDPDDDTRNVGDMFEVLRRAIETRHRVMLTFSRQSQIFRHLAEPYHIRNGWLICWDIDSRRMRQIDGFDLLDVRQSNQAFGVEHWD